MKKRLDIENPLYDGDASASAFGWQFQVDAAIFLFLYYIEEIEEWHQVQIFLKRFKVL